MLLGMRWWGHSALVVEKADIASQGRCQLWYEQNKKHSVGNTDAVSHPSTSPQFHTSPPLSAAETDQSVENATTRAHFQSSLPKSSGEPLQYAHLESQTEERAAKQLMLAPQASSSATIAAANDDIFSIIPQPPYGTGPPSADFAIIKFGNGIPLRLSSTHRTAAPCLKEGLLYGVGRHRSGRKFSCE